MNANTLPGAPSGRAPRGAGQRIVTVLGITFKENVPDIRNSKVVDIVKELERFGVTVQVHDPLALPHEVKNVYDVTMTPTDALKPADAVILAVGHKEYRDKGWPLITGLLKDGEGVLLDVKWMLDRSKRPEKVELWRL